jgi:hypothetical protein
MVDLRKNEEMQMARTTANGIVNEPSSHSVDETAHRSRSVKTATDGRRHPDTYTNKKRQKTPTNIEQHRRPPMRTKSS